MNWLIAWWRELTGRHPDPAAVRDRPDILEVRQKQHDQISRLTTFELETELYRRRLRPKGDGGGVG